MLPKIFNLCADTYITTTNQGVAMKTKYRWEMCEKCKGKRFDNQNRLCSECGGDGCCLVLVDWRQDDHDKLDAGLQRLVNDLANDACRKE
jgi:hypothetical protein